MLESTIYMKNACDIFVAKNVLFKFIYMWKAPVTEINGHFRICLVTVFTLTLYKERKSHSKEQLKLTTTHVFIYKEEFN